MKVIILAGGLGTRLRRLLSDLPKPLAPIDNKPFLAYLIAFLSSWGFIDFIISSGHGAEAIKEFLGDGSTRGLDIQYTFEEELLGTAGAIKLAETLIDSDDFIVTNGDTYFEVDLNAMLRLHEAKAAIATVALLSIEDTGRYGSVVLGEDNEIISFSEKAIDGGKGLINGGIYIFRKEIFDFIPAGKVCSLERDVLPLLIHKGLYGFPSSGYFIDIGIPEDYERAKRELPLRGVT
jgi:D-glycero-alpha-D-manno-heptose 1-phosphate guanylyltransferase